MNSRNDPCWCGSGKKWKKCHWPQEPVKAPYEERARKYKSQYGILIKSENEISHIRKACQLSSQILQETCKKAAVGITTNELHELVMKLHKDAGAKPACLGYGSPPFPKSICTSLNNVICHGIPDNTPLMDGDIVSIDVSSILHGFYGDCCATVMIGNVSEEKRRVTEVSYESLMAAIRILKPGVLLHEIGTAIEDYATQKGCSVVNQFVGHGVGVKFHESPEVPHHYNTSAIPLAEGMTFTIEPMINAGKREGTVDAKDGWTVRTVDGRPSAQWEHTILITSDGYELLTFLPHA